MEEEDSIENVGLEEENNDKWLIDITEERKYWQNYVLKYDVYLSDTYPQCEETKIIIDKLNILLNPIRFASNSYKYKYRTNFRKFSFFTIIPRNTFFSYFQNII